MRLSHHFFSAYTTTAPSLYIRRWQLFVWCWQISRPLDLFVKCKLSLLLSHSPPFRCCSEYITYVFLFSSGASFGVFGAGWPAILCLMHFCSVVSVENDSNDLSNPKRDNLFAALLKLHYTVSALAAHCQQHCCFCKKAEWMLMVAAVVVQFFICW